MAIYKYNSKHALSILCLVFAFVLLFAGCGDETAAEDKNGTEASETPSSTVYQASNDTQMRQPQMQAPPMGNRQEAAAKTSNVPYDAIEKADLETISDLFSDGGADVFVMTEYESAKAIDPDDLFREGIITGDFSKVSARELSEDERAVLEAAGIAADDDCYITKVTSQQASSFLEAYTGLTLDSLETDFDEFTYVSAYDAWYLSTEDSGISKVTLNSGYVDPDGNLSMSYIKTQGGDSDVVFGRFSLEKSDTGYKFLTNEFIYSTSEYTGTRSWSSNSGGPGGPS
ncbi:MAG: hypothetical protein E7430_04860 [Ruminococcaceae bacterium]|nr:hypothetical protein [Oscillospiraceae bacterium]